MNAKISVFVICVEAIIHLLLYNLHDCTFKGSSTERLYQELGLESLQNRQWFQKLSVFYKIVKEKFPKYLYDLISSKSISYQTRNSQNLVIPQFKIRNKFFLIFFHQH